MKNLEQKECDLKFYNGKKVLITGHTGFKGSWLCKLLILLGAEVYGYALKPETTPNLFDITKMENQMTSEFGDIRDKAHLQKYMQAIQPEIIFHLAAQPLVRKSYNDPVLTYETNIMGTVNILECIRNCSSVRSFVNITTDKVYKNREWCWGYRENEELMGYDPYSSSKSCSELVTYTYHNCFFSNGKVAISTARAGNVVGGGDFSEDRIIPDCIRALQKDEDIIVRNPYSIRPYQHVLDPLYAYMLIAYKQYEDKKYCGCYNVGPDESNCIETGRLVDIFCDKVYHHIGKKMKWINCYDGGPKEAQFLKLDCSKMKGIFHWEPRWNIDRGIDKTVEFVSSMVNGRCVNDCMMQQIQEFIDCQK